MAHTTAMSARMARFTRLRTKCSDTEETRDRQDLHLWVGLPLHSTPLTGCNTGIEYYLGVDASEKNNANGPVRVAKYCAAKENRLQIYGRLLSIPSDSGVELIHVRIWPITFDRE